MFKPKPSPNTVTRVHHRMRSKTGNNTMHIFCVIFFFSTGAHSPLHEKKTHTKKQENKITVYGHDKRKMHVDPNNKFTN